jgi:hypothetical protein
MTAAAKIVSALLEDDSLDSMEGSPRMSREALSGVQHRERTLLQSLHNRFVDEHVHGYTNRDGTKNAPMSRQEAELRWKSVEAMFIVQGEVAHFH